MIDVAITEKLFDEDFMRRWSNGTFLVRRDNGAALTEADLSASGSPSRYVAWGEISDAPVLYDSATGSYEREGARLALAGERRIATHDGREVVCEPAFARLASLAAQFRPELSAHITWVAAAKVREAVHMLAANRPVSMFMHNGVGQHTNATQTSRAIATFYALFGNFDQPGGNVVFPKAPLSAVSGREFLSKEMALQRIGRERKPLGPPAKPGNCAAYDIFTAVLEQRPYPVKALLNFGSNTVMNTGDSQRARQAFRALYFAVAAELFMTPTAELCDYVLPATSFLEMSNLSNDFKHRQLGRLHVQYRPAVIEPLGERRSDTWIVFELAKRLGLGEKFWQGDIAAAYEYELAPTGISLADLKAAPGGVTVSRVPRYRKFAEDQNGNARGFNTPDKKVAVYSHIFAAHGYAPMPEYIEPMISPASRPDIAGEYPLVLTNAKFTTYIHSQLRGLASLRKAAPHPTADIHPETAERYGISDKAWMIIESPRGSIRAKARVTDGICAGVICCQHGWWQECKELELPGYDSYGAGSANPSLLIGSDITDPISGSLPHRSLLCRVRPAEPAHDGVHPWFCPGRGRELSHRIAAGIASARRRVRIATPLLTSGPILAAIDETDVDLAGVCDLTQVEQVFRQWEAEGRSHWKVPLLRHALTRFTGKRSTPWSHGTVHDFMHAKVTVADDVVFLGSFNLSRSGEMNAENVLEIADAALAERMAAWIDALRTHYPERG
jgi:anaerobic selenocysteine-containing dehydrogenase